ncbi:hypothetical protein Tco_0459181 [Tanacetum coccineum]
MLTRRLNSHKRHANDKAKVSVAWAREGCLLSDLLGQLGYESNPRKPSRNSSIRFTASLCEHFGSMNGKGSGLSGGFISLCNSFVPGSPIGILVSGWGKSIQTSIISSIDIVVDYLHEDSDWRNQQERLLGTHTLGYCHGTCCYWWLDSFDKNDLPHKLHNFVQPLLRGRKLGFGSFYLDVSPTMSLSSAATSDDDCLGGKSFCLIFATKALFLDESFLRLLLDNF